MTLPPCPNCHMVGEWMRMPEDWWCRCCNCGYVMEFVCPDCDDINIVMHDGCKFECQRCGEEYEWTDSGLVRLP